MKKIRKGQKTILIIIAVILLIIASVFIIKGIVKHNEEQHQEQANPERVIPLPETTYSNMKVQNIAIQYMKENDQTKLMFEIVNTTDKPITSQNFDAILIDKDQNVIGSLLTQVQDLEVGEPHQFEIIYAGDLTQTNEIKLRERTK